MSIAQIVTHRKSPWAYGVIRRQHPNGLYAVEWSDGSTGNYFSSDLRPLS
jgi:hypothetical protein